jgi:O-methyltransferase
MLLGTRNRKLRQKIANYVRRKLLGDSNIAAGSMRPPMEVVPLDSINAARLMFLERLCLVTKDIPGDIVECGVGGGYSFLFLAHTIHIHHLPKYLWGFDSFEGFPEPTDEDTSYRNVRKGEHTHHRQQVETMIRNHLNDELFFRSKLSLIKGLFENTLHIHEGHISLLHLDVDLYLSYKVCLETLYPKVSPGGIVIFDEYHREGAVFPGAAKAIDEYFADKDVTFTKDHLYGKYFVVKK